MEIVRQCPFNSGYQPQPVPPPSAGRALSVLIAVCAVLWVWWMLPDWVTSELLFHREAWTWLILVLISNGSVFWWSTRLMWNSPRLNNTSELKRGLVLMLCMLFHLLWLVLWLLLIR